MPIILQEIVEVLPHTGKFRGRFKYTFDDGREVFRRHINLDNDTTAATTAMGDLADSAFKEIERIDLNEAIEQDLPIAAYKEASLLKVARQYIKKAMAEDDPYVSYLKLKKANDYIIAQGWTNAQVKSQLNLTEAQWSAIKDRYLYLSGNSANLVSHDTIKAGDTIRENI
jgi:hypothetical protein